MKRNLIPLLFIFLALFSSFPITYAQNNVCQLDYDNQNSDELSANVYGSGSISCVFQGVAGDTVQIAFGCGFCRAILTSPSNQVTELTTASKVFLSESGRYVISAFYDFGSSSDLVEDEFGQSSVQEFGQGGYVSMSVKRSAAASNALAGISALEANTLVYTAPSPENIWALYATNALSPDHSNAVQLTSSDFNAYQPAVSPDGTKIVFVHGVDENSSDLWIMNVDGQNLRQLTRQGGLEGRPSWSPDGKLIAFQHQELFQEEYNIYVIEANSTYPYEFYDASDASYPSWSPNGRQIIFSAFNEETQSNEIFSQAIDPDINRIMARFPSTKLTNTPDVNEYHPQWSPDGQMIAFTQWWGSDDEFTAIAVMGVSSTSPIGSELIVLHEADNASIYTQPKWSPDSSQIAFRFYDKNSETSSVAVTDLSRNLQPNFIDGIDISSISWYGS